MSLITVLWSMAAAAALTLGLVHALVWAYDRRALANLTFSMIALAMACMAPIELRLMHAVTPQEYGMWVRWLQVPVFLAITGLVLFVRLYLRAGRAWLAWTIIALRGVVLLGNFILHPNFSFRQIISLETVSLLGEQVSTVGQAVVGPWQWLATASLILLTVFVTDAARAVWRRGGTDARGKALIVGGGTLIFVVVAAGQTQLLIWGLVRIPVLVTPLFLITLLAMAFELSRELLRAAGLARGLRDSEQRLDLAVGAAGIGIWVWDVAASKVQMTDRARALHGFQEEVVDFERWLGAIHPDDLAAVRREAERAVWSGEEFNAEYRIRHPQRALRWLAAHGRSEAAADGRSVMMRGILRDITDRKGAQYETEDLRRELAHSGRVTLLGQLSSSLAHELNQPLGAILRNAEAAQMLLQAAAPDLDELRAIVSDIRKDDRRAGEVIDRLRALLKRRSVELHPLAVEALVQDVLKVVRYDAGVRHVALDFIAVTGLPLALGDRVHLSQVLLNLIINGMDAVSELPVSSRRVVIEARHVDGMIQVAVTDSGHGVAPEVVDNVFDPFYTTKAHGMGMGLPVSRTIVEAHGGKLWLETQQGTPGASFRFTLRAVQGLFDE